MFSIDDIQRMEKKNAVNVIAFMQKNSGKFTTMNELINKFGSGARPHIKDLEGKRTFRVKRMDENSKSVKPIDFWTYVDLSTLNSNTRDKFVEVLKTEGYNITFDNETQEPVKVIPEDLDVDSYFEKWDNKNKHYQCKECSTKIPTKSNRKSHIIDKHL